MSRRTAVAAALTALVLTVPACRSGRTAGTGAAAAVPFVAVDPASQSPTDRAIATAQATLQQAPNDPRASVDLARAFLQKSREVADPSLYTKATGLLNQAAKTMPNDPALLAAQGELQALLARQDAVQQQIDQLTVGQLTKPRIELLVPGYGLDGAVSPRPKFAAAAGALAALIIAGVAVAVIGRRWSTSKG